MSSVTNATSNSLVAVLNTVNVAAQQAARTVTTAASGLDMLDAFVQKAKAEQAMRHTVDAVTYQMRLVREATDREVISQQEIAKKMKADAEYAQLYAATKAHLDAAFTQVATKP